MEKGEGVRVLGGNGRKRAAIKAIFAAYVSPSIAFFFFNPIPSGFWGGIGEMMSGIRFLVVVDSYAIALYPFSFPSPFLGGRRDWGKRGNSMGLILDARSQFFFFFPQKKSVYFTLTLSLGRAYLTRLSKLVILIKIYYWVFVRA